MTSSAPSRTPPSSFVATSDRVIVVLGYRDIGQDVILEDWEPDRTGPAMTADALREVPAAGDAAIVLFHAWPSGTLDALPGLIDGLRAIGGKFVRIDELERDQTAAAPIPPEAVRSPAVER